MDGLQRKKGAFLSVSSPWEESFMAARALFEERVAKADAKANPPPGSNKRKGGPMDPQWVLEQAEKEMVPSKRKRSNSTSFMRSSPSVPSLLAEDTEMAGRFGSTPNLPSIVLPDSVEVASSSAMESHSSMNPSFLGAVDPMLRSGFSQMEPLRPLFQNNEEVSAVSFSLDNFSISQDVTMEEDPSTPPPPPPPRSFVVNNNFNAVSVFGKRHF